MVSKLEIASGTFIRLNKLALCYVPYLKIAERVMPNLSMLQRLTVVRPKRLQDIDVGEINRVGTSKFHITICNGEWTKNKTRSVFDLYTQLEMARHLAHELAHLAMYIRQPPKFWLEHHTEHERYQNYLMDFFTFHLDAIGYTGEEDERAHDKCLK